MARKNSKKNTLYFSVEDSYRGWHWFLRSPNGSVLGRSSHGYSSERSARRAAEVVMNAKQFVLVEGKPE